MYFKLKALVSRSFRYLFINMFSVLASLYNRNRQMHPQNLCLSEVIRHSWNTPLLIMLGPPFFSNHPTHTLTNTNCDNEVFFSVLGHYCTSEHDFYVILDLAHLQWLKCPSIWKKKNLKPVMPASSVHSMQISCQECDITIGTYSPGSRDIPDATQVKILTARLHLATKFFLVAVQDLALQIRFMWYGSKWLQVMEW